MQWDLNLLEANEQKFSVPLHMMFDLPGMLIPLPLHGANTRLYLRSSLYDCPLEIFLWPFYMFTVKLS